MIRRDLKLRAAGFVLAGGRSSRMGSDKALVKFCGKTLLFNSVDVFYKAGLEVSIAGNRLPLEGFVPVIPDSAIEHGRRGPLAGICAGLAATERDFAVFLPVDMPLIPASLLTFLVEYACGTDSLITLVSVNGFAQTFPAVVSRIALPSLRTRLDAGEGGCFAGFQAAASALGKDLIVLPVEMLVQAGQVSQSEGLPAVQWFHNVNTPEDLARAHAMVRRTIRVS